MTKEEIKQAYSMQRVVAEYGIKVNRAGFISCPFHREKTASMKIYKDSFHCFGCGTSGDVFTFVSQMHHCSFKEAFMRLGGTYEAPTFESNLLIYRRKKEQEEIKAKQIKEEQKKELNNMLIDIYRSYIRRSEPLSDTWCDCYNALQYQLYVHEILNRKGVCR